MYNEDLKVRYLTESRLNNTERTYIRHIFAYSEQIEEEQGKDLCEFTKNDLKLLEAVLPGSSSKTFKVIGSSIRSYVDWCKSVGLKTSEVAEQTRLDNTAAARKHWFKSPMDLERTLNTFFSPVSDGDYEILYRCYFWLAFCGLDKPDIFELKTSDVDFMNASIYVQRTGAVYPIYREAIPALRAACELPSFNYYRDHFKKPSIRPRPLGGSEVMRGFNGRLSPTRFTGQVSRHVKNVSSYKGLDFGPTFKDVRMSGVMYRAYEVDVLGEVPVDELFDSIVDAEIQERMAEKELSDRDVVQLRSRLRLNYISNYNAWKRAFHSI